MSMHSACIKSATGQESEYVSGVTVSSTKTAFVWKMSHTFKGSSLT